MVGMIPLLVLLVLSCTMYQVTSLPVSVEFGTNLGVHVTDRIKWLVGQVPTYDGPACVASSPLYHEVSYRSTADCGAPVTKLQLSFGNTAAAAKLIPAAQLAALGDEGFIVATQYSDDGTLIIAANGNGDITISPISASAIGSVMAAYRVLESLGFAFLHPLQPLIPSVWSIPTTATGVWFNESRQWHHRGFHIHTEHPLELTDVLNGFDVIDTANPSHNESWSSMLPNVDRMFEWSVANGINRIEWVLLGAKDWEAFAYSTLRQQRLNAICTLAHAYGIGCGADVALAIRQQHGWWMADTTKPIAEQIESIHNRTDWLVAAGFDFINTENGLSEFTHPSDDLMLRLMNEFSTYVAQRWNRATFIKIHCSTGQFCTNHTDPRTGQPLNFNFLPIFATESLGLMPHTVQAYAFEDPAPVYGNQNFTYMRDFLYWQAQTSKREVIYHGETNYWVNVDIDVPLFLPIYGAKRLQDLRTIATDEASKGWKMAGQMNFDSGWEWGSWLQDVVTARAAWNPHMELSEADALTKLLLPAMRPFGPAVGVMMTQWVLRVIKQQEDVLILGKVKGKSPSQIAFLNGFAYLMGFDTWCELPRLVGLHCTQPDKITYNQTSHPLYSQVLPLVQEMDNVFTELWRQIRDVSSQIPDSARGIYNELVDSIAMTALRAQHVHFLYEASNPKNPSARTIFLNQSLNAIAAAQVVVARREALYRVPAWRIAGWRTQPNTGPTAYGFGYLWTVHSLFYWWRDYGQVVGGSLEAQLSPCYLNMMNVADIAIGEFAQVAAALRQLMKDHKWIHLLTDCLAPPTQEYVFPRDLFRY